MVLIPGNSGNQFFSTNIARPSALAGQPITFFANTLDAVYKSTAISDYDPGSQSYGLIWTNIGDFGVNSYVGENTRPTPHTIGISPFSNSQTIAIILEKGTKISISSSPLAWSTFDLNTLVPGGFSQANSPLFYGALRLYVVSQNPAPGSVRVAWSEDYDEPWVRSDKGLPDVPIDKIDADLLHSYLYAATWLGMYYSTDAGSSWSQLGSGLPLVRINDFYIGQTSIVVGTFGRGVWELPLPGLVAVDKTHDSLDNYDGTIEGMGMAYLPELPSGLVAGLDHINPKTCHDACQEKLGSTQFWYNIYVENGIGHCTCVRVKDFGGNHRTISGAYTFGTCVIENNIAIKTQVNARKVMLGKTLKLTVMLKSWNKAFTIEDLGLSLALPAGVSYVKSSVSPNKAIKKMDKMPAPSISNDAVSWSDFNIAPGKSRKFSIYLHVGQDALALNLNKRLSFAPMAFQVDPIDGSTFCEETTDALTVSH